MERLPDVPVSERYKRPSAWIMGYRTLCQLTLAMYAAVLNAMPPRFQLDSLPMCTEESEAAITLQVCHWLTARLYRHESAAHGVDTSTISYMLEKAEQPFAGTSSSSNERWVRAVALMHFRDERYVGFN